MWRRPSNACCNSVTAGAHVLHKHVWGKHKCSEIGGTHTVKSNSAECVSLLSLFAPQQHALHYKQCPKDASRALPVVMHQRPGGWLHLVMADLELVVVRFQRKSWVGSGSGGGGAGRHGSWGEAVVAIDVTWGWCSCTVDPLPCTPLSRSVGHTGAEGKVGLSIAAAVGGGG